MSFYLEKLIGYIKLAGRAIGMRMFRVALLTILAVYGSASLGAPEPAAPNQNYVRLSEVGGCEKLQSFLAQKLVPPFNGIYPATLVIDSKCELNTPIVLPRRMTLAGVGIDGEGMLFFPSLPDDTPAVSIQEDVENPQNGVSVTLRDLAIYGPGSAEEPQVEGIGLELLNDSQVTLERVRISDFRTGIFGRNSFSVSISHSNVSNNGTNLLLNGLANTWRIRDNIFKQAGSWGVRIDNSNGVLLDGNRFELNGEGGIWVEYKSAYIFISNNRFEQNALTKGNQGVRIEPDSLDTRVLTNIFSANTLLNASPTTRCAFNGQDPDFLFDCPVDED